MLSSIKKSKKIKFFKHKFYKFFYLLQDFSFIFFCTFANLITLKMLFRKNIILVSAASEEYYKYLEVLVKKAIKTNYFKKIIIYDLGLSTSQILILKKNKHIEYRKFNFSEYPDFFSTKDSSNQFKIGSYAWKAAIIYEVMMEFKSQIVWLDSANLINKFFIFYRIALTYLGSLSPFSVDKISKWTYLDVLRKLQVDQKIYNKTNLNGAIIGFDYHNNRGLSNLVKWKNYCFDEDLICPEGSNRSNHRQDQSLLSIVLYESKMKYYPKTSKIFGLKIHNWFDRVYYIVEPRSQSLKNIRNLWYNQNSNISTNTFSDAKKIVFMDSESFKRFSKLRLINKEIYLFSERIETKNLSFFYIFIKLKKAYFLGNKFNFEFQNNIK